MTCLQRKIQINACEAVLKSLFMIFIMFRTRDKMQNATD